MPPSRSRGSRGSRGSTGRRSAPSLKVRTRRSKAPTRLAWAFVAMCVAFGGMALRLVGLQIFSAPRFTKLAADQREREVEFPARRGAIFDRDGQPLAISVDPEPVVDA